MTSTRNKNAQGDYNVKKQESVMIRDYLLYNDYANTKNPVLFSLGSNPSFYSGVLSQNSIDIESKLRGIRSVNLEGPSFDVIPKFKSIPTVSYFERHEVLLPKPYIQSTSERPNYLSVNKSM
jgi:hypothetical protein